MTTPTTPDTFAQGLDLPHSQQQSKAQPLLYRVQGSGKYAALFARDKGHARERFATEFYVGVAAERCEQIN